jgi:hypothetical protein
LHEGLPPDRDSAQAERLSMGGIYSRFRDSQNELRQSLWVIDFAELIKSCRATYSGMMAVRSSEMALVV